MSVTDAIASFATGVYTVTRRAAGTSTKGKVTPGEASTFTIQASVQPLGGRELMRLTEGQRASERRLVFTTVELRTGTLPDVITLGDEPWEVEAVESWVTPLGTFYKVTAARAVD